MSNIDKQIAKLHIDAAALRGEVDAVNRELKRIGEGTSLDLTKQVKEQIKLLQATAGGGTSSGGSAGKRTNNSNELKKEIALVNTLSRELIKVETQIQQYKTRSLKLESGSKELSYIQEQLKLRQAEADAIKKQIHSISEKAVADSKYQDAVKKSLELQEKLNQAIARQQDVTQKQNQNKQVGDANKEVEKLLRLQREIADLSKELNREQRLGGGNGDYAAELQRQLALKQQAYAAGVQEQEQLDEKTREQVNYNKLQEEEKRLDDATRLKILKEETEEQRKQNKQQDDFNRKIDETVKRMLKWAATMVVMRGLSTLWRNAKEYVSSFYDKMNEIRIVTMMTQEEANRLGESYRGIAEEMSVSSTEIATAAVEFWRQGLDESEVNSRLENTIMYAKISGLEFEEAAEIVTAATNSIESDAGRVVDVLAYLGDASASGADEVGVAMQKAAASAEQFGLSFEWLGAYIATISEETRQAPEVIGTSLNSIMARLHQIKQTGYSEDDETRINDVAKALSTVDVALLDQSGNWRSMSAIMNDVAAQWSDMDARQQSYIATTMAGTRQQNHFLALMNDLAKGVEGGSRAWELYAGALGAAGVATEKFSIWEESVTAAQDRMKASLENLYSLLSAEWMKGFYDGMAGVIRFFTDGTEAMEGMNIVIPLIVGGIGQLVVAINKLVQSMIKAGGAGAFLKTVFSKHPIAMIAAGVATQIPIFTAFGNAVSDTSASYEEAMQTISDANERIVGLKNAQNNLVKSFERLAGKTDKTDEENAEYLQTLGELKAISPEIEQAIQNFTDKIIDQEEAVRNVNAELEKNIELEKDLAMGAAVDALQKWQPSYQPGFNSTQGLDTYYIDPNEIASVKEDLQNLIDLAVAFQNAYDFSEIEMKAYEKGLLNAIYGTDDRLSYAEYWDAPLTLQTNSGNIARSVLNKQSEELNKYMLELMLQSVFGEESMEEIGRQIEDAIKDPELVDRILKAYEDLFAMGASKEAIAGIFESFGLEYFKLYEPSYFIEERLKELANIDYSQFNWFDGQTLTYLNDEAKVLMVNLLAAGTSAEEFYRMFSDSESLEEFIFFLQQGRTEAQLFSDSLYDLAEQARKTIAEDKAETTGYADFIRQMQDAFSAPEGAFAMGFNMDGLIEQWNSFDAEMQKSIAETYPNLVIALYDAAKAYEAFEESGEDCSEEFAKLDDEMKGISKSLQARHFKSTEKAISDLRKGAINVADAFADYNSEAQSAIEASSEYKTALAKLADGMELTEDDVSSLADYLGYITPGELLKDWDKVGPMISAALAEGEDAFRRLNEAAFIHITGASSADFSSITDGLLVVQGMAQDTIDALIATGQWELDTIDLPGRVYSQLANGKVVPTFFEGHQTVLKYKGASALGSGKSGYTPSTSTSSKGGGGGGGGPTKGDTEVEIMLDKMEQVQTIQDHTRSLYSGQASLYESRGELQGVIKYIEKEKGAIEDQNKTLEENIANIEAHMLKKQQEVAAMSKSAKGYEDAADDLDKLQKAHQDYTLQLIENQTELEELNKAIKEHQDAIREMQINLRETILQAIEDREALNDRMLQGTIEVENEILDIIRERYEEERDMILETSEEKIDALEKEKNLLQEQLDLRKQQAEEEDKAAKLKQLEAQLSRISADPTRKKEELELRKEIAELREEIAWDIADKEVEAQQKAIDDQITSVEDYMEYIENYYEDLFAHPTKLINEMKEIIKRSDEEIIQWLKENSEEYAASTEATQKNMVNSWNDMLMDMHGQIKTYWDEVEQIIAGGDDAIIAFLMENSADYRAAGKLQAEAYVDEWRKQLDDLRNALKEVNAEIEAPNYSTIEKPSGSSGGGGGGSSGSTTTSDLYTYKFKNKAGTWSGAYTDKSMSLAFNKAKDAAISHYTAAGMTDVVKQIVAASLFSNGAYIQKFARGGLANFTGPAWLDGTKTNPERVLSPYQTKLFDEMIKVLQRIDTISVPGIPAYGDTGKANTAYNVGDIIVNVDRLESDADYEEMAEKIFDTIMNRLNRTAPVGGIRMNR